MSFPAPLPTEDRHEPAGMAVDGSYVYWVDSGTGYVFRTHKWNDRFILAPRQEGGALLGDAAADKSPHVFVIRWRLEMNSAHLRPIEDAIGQPMLQVA